VIKIALRGTGGELDCRVITPTEGNDEAYEADIRTAVLDIVYNSVLAPGDTITIEDVY
jgi:hypothetical protein